MNGTSTIACFVQDVSPEHEGLRIQWGGDNQVSYFPYRWLVENAPEFRNRHGHCGLDSTTLPVAIRPKFIHLYQNNVLELGWNEFSRTTCFSTVGFRENGIPNRGLGVASHAA
ncbi:MAG: hypothetical protein IH978_08110 [Nitrospinae bacterium]|nr:hypothetical protein [Nitrospinota bacterium]